jgi:hypothetical protein
MGKGTIVQRSVVIRKAFSLRIVPPEALAPASFLRDAAEPAFWHGAHSSIPLIQSLREKGSAMFHKRRWTIAPVGSAEELAEKLSQHTWCGCNGFELGDYWFLNDATGGDGAQEYAVVKKVGRDGNPWQVESITFSWCSYERALELIQTVLKGEQDRADWARPVEPIVESAAEHGRCGHCA